MDYENELYRKILHELLHNHLYQTIEMYGEENDVMDFEPILTDLGISSSVLDGYRC
jgi:hypothetical protein